MRRTWIVLVVLVLAVLLLVMPGIAAAEPGRQFFSLTGVIAEDGVATEAITVNVLSGNRFVKKYIDGELEVQMTETTDCKRHTDSGPDPMFDCDDLAGGDDVLVQGTYDDGFTAERVVVDKPEE